MTEINNVAYAEKYLKFKTCRKWTEQRIEIKRGFVTRIFIVEYQRNQSSVTDFSGTKRVTKNPQ